MKMTNLRDFINCNCTQDLSVVDYSIHWPPELIVKSLRSGSVSNLQGNRHPGNAIDDDPLNVDHKRGPGGPRSVI